MIDIVELENLALKAGGAVLGLIVFFMIRNMILGRKR